ncbi:zinc finger protein 64-like [Plodia interpunctella]|uniref:zinc finger protein 64-like n=1 Tax=Plodia interpunctella TaxID=58824 RepID=UPI0023688682|nr:zinc finger protein 64-like [Plodia interpunctella]
MAEGPVRDPLEMLEVTLSTTDAHDVKTLCKHHNKKTKTVKQDVEEGKSINTRVTHEIPIAKALIKRKRKEYYCAACNFMAKSKKSYNRHTQSQGHRNKLTKEEHKHKCNLCNAKDMDGFKKCPMCNYETENIRSYKLHLNIHNKGLPFKCTSCDYAGQNIKDLMAHHKTVTKYCTKGHCKYSTHFPEELKMHKKLCTW